MLLVIRYWLLVIGTGFKVKGITQRHSVLGVRPSGWMTNTGYSMLDTRCWIPDARRLEGLNARMLGGEKVEKEIKEKFRSWVGNGINSFFKSKIRNLIRQKHGRQESEIEIFCFQIFLPSHLPTFSTSFLPVSLIRHSIRRRRTIRHSK